ncbi:protocadherin gamma-C5 [Striga asiatica]|uniref:Protocadherin gamma-C5 n=1 Tax=Striga asiatica TaxID=4170 RepID=A0A5A7R249_STRAF|nr:protocadherin gamma-C5 [Striga asiatica]
MTGKRDGFLSYKPLSSGIKLADGSLYSDGRKASLKVIGGNANRTRPKSLVTRLKPVAGRIKSDTCKERNSMSRPGANFRFKQGSRLWSDFFLNFFRHRLLSKVKGID